MAFLPTSCIVFLSMFVVCFQVGDEQLVVDQLLPFSNKPCSPSPHIASATVSTVNSSQSTNEQCCALEARAKVVAKETVEDLLFVTREEDGSYMVLSAGDTRTASLTTILFLLVSVAS